MNRTITLKLTKDVDYFAIYDTLFLSAMSPGCVWARYVRIITHRDCNGFYAYWGIHVSGEGVYEVWLE